MAIVYVAHEHDCCDDSYQASARAVCVVRLVSTADSRTERLHVPNADSV